MLHQLEPTWTIRIYERLGDVALESSNPWNNAGTGHAALCELNYTPERADGTIDIANAVKVNEQFQVSRQFWSYLVGQGLLPEPGGFLTSTPQRTSSTCASVSTHSKTTLCSRAWNSATTRRSFAGGRRSPFRAVPSRSPSRRRAWRPAPTSTLALSLDCSSTGSSRAG
jgi:L-2-hydroxyglutarate oxidase LhgO